jgi:hypothetical protein
MVTKAVSRPVPGDTSILDTKMQNCSGWPSDNVRGPNLQSSVPAIIMMVDP